MAERVLFVTGASSGIGAAAARRAVAAGLRVALVARTEERLTALSSELGGREWALPLPCDVTSWDDLQHAVALTLDRFGRLDIAFANAGMAGQKGFLAGDVERWQMLVLTNVLGPALTIRATLPALYETHGQVVLTGSVAGRRILSGSLYSCTKSAVAAFAESLRMEVQGSGVRVTLLEPGIVATPQFRDPPVPALTADEVAEAVMYVITRPVNVDIGNLVIRPAAHP